MILTIPNAFEEKRSYRFSLGSIISKEQTIGEKHQFYNVSKNACKGKETLCSGPQPASRKANYEPHPKIA